MNPNVHPLRALLAATFSLAAGFATAPATAASITIVNDGCASFKSTTDGANLTISCDTGTPSPGAPSGCALAASNTTLPKGGGGPVTLTATCSGAVVPDKYTWSGPSVSTATGPGENTLTIASITATSTYTVTPSTAGVAGNSPSVRVTVQTDTPPVTGPISCSGFVNTKVIEATVPQNGAINNLYYTSKGVFGSGVSPGFGAKDAIVIRFVTPVSDPYFRITMNQSSGATSTAHTAVLSTAPCDFAVPSGKGLFAASTRATFAITMAAGVPAASGYTLEGGQTYFLNVSNNVNGAWSCSSSACDVFFTFENFAP